MRREARWALIAILAAAPSCSSKSSNETDGAPSGSGDAAGACELSVCGEQCVDTTSDPEHCGGCSAACTPSQSCDSSSCVCPQVAFGSESLILSEMDPDMLAPTILGIGAYSGEDDEVHAFVAGYLDPETPLDTDIDLAEVPAGEAPFVGVGFSIDLLSRQTRSTFTSIGGTLHLTRRCAEGVAGEVTDAVLVEVDDSVEPSVVFEDGCTITLPSLTFDFGADCP